MSTARLIVRGNKMQFQDIPTMTNGRGEPDDEELLRIWNGVSDEDILKHRAGQVKLGYAAEFKLSKSEVGGMTPEERQAAVLSALDRLIRLRGIQDPVILERAA